MITALASYDLEVRPVTGRVGTEILGIDLRRQQPEEVWETIRAAFTQYGVVFFRDQDLTPGQLVAVAEHFGSVQATPNMAGVDGDDRVMEVRKEPDEVYNIGDVWHSDQSASPRPVRGTMLLAKEMPEWGGDTCFINVALAYEALSDGLKHTLDGLRAFHTDARAYAKHAAGLALTGKTFDLKTAAAEAFHPAVIRLPENGKKALYLSPGRTIHFEGWTEEESANLLKFLFAHCQKPEYLCRFRWQTGSIAFWDNYQSWHYAVNDYHGQRRVMHRVTVHSDPFN